VLEGYGRRAHIRTDHLRLVAGYLGWKSAPPDSSAMKELAQFLLDRAMEHDSPTLLFSLACEYLIAAKTIRPGVSTLAKMVASARTGASMLTWEQVAHLVTGQRRAGLDRLLVYEPVHKPAEPGRRWARASRLPITMTMAHTTMASWWAANRS
jgi:hypothetical protein